MIRPARVEDGEELARLFLESARHHLGLDPDLYQVPDRDDVIKEHQQWVGRADRAILVAEVDRRPAGFVSIRMLDPSARPSMIRPRRRADLGIVVTEDLRGRGIGAGLMEAAENWARERGAEMLTLDGHVANTGALHFYERMGYRTIGLFMVKAVHDAG